MNWKFYVKFATFSASVERATDLITINCCCFYIKLIINIVSVSVAVSVSVSISSCICICICKWGMCVATFVWRRRLMYVRFDLIKPHLQLKTPPPPTSAPLVYLPHPSPGNYPRKRECKDAGASTVSREQFQFKSEWKILISGVYTNFPPSNRVFSWKKLNKIKLTFR